MVCQRKATGPLLLKLSEAFPFTRRAAVPSAGADRLARIVDRGGDGPQNKE